MLGLPNYCADFERQYDWVQIGNLSTEQAALAVTGRDNASVVALTATGRIIWTPDDGTAAAALRFRVNGTDGDQFQVLIYGARGADYYTLIADLTLDQGTQDWSSGHFVDVIVAAEQWVPGLRTSSKSNEIGMVYLNTAGFDRFVIISPDCTDDDISNVYVDAVRVDKKIDVASEIHSTLISVEAGTSNLESQMETQETQLTAIDSELVNIEADTTQIAAGTSNLESQMITQQTSLTAIDSELVNAATSLVAIDSELVLIDTDTTKISSQLETQETQLTAVDSELVNVAASAVAIDSELVLIEADSTKLVSQMETQEVQLTAIDSELVNVAANTDGVESQLETLESVLTTIENDNAGVLLLDSILAGTSNLESQMETLETITGTGNTSLAAIDSELVLIEADSTKLVSQMETTETSLVAIDSELVLIDTDTTKISSQLETQETQLTAVDSGIVNTAISLVACDSELVNIEADTTQIAAGTSNLESQMETTEIALTAIDSGIVNAATSLVAVDSELVNIAADAAELTNAPVAKVPVKIVETVDVVSTAQQLIVASTYARHLYLQAKKVAADNTGNVFIGLSDLDQAAAELFELIPGATYELKMPAGCKVELNNIYIDADNANDGVVGWYIPV